MAKVTTTNYALVGANPRWAGDFAEGREHNLAGGARVDPTAFSAGSDGRKFIAAGTPVGRTFAEATANTGFSPAADDTDDEYYLLLHDVTDALVNPDCELYRHGSLVYVNLLPGWGSLSAGHKARIRALYECTNGVD